MKFELRLVTAVVARYMKCIGMVVVADPLRSMERLSLYFSVLSWWTNSMFLTHSSPLYFVAWHLLHRKGVLVLQYCTIYSA